MVISFNAVENFKSFEFTRKKHDLDSIPSVQFSNSFFPLFQVWPRDQKSPSHDQRRLSTTRRRNSMPTVAQTARRCSQKDPRPSAAPR